MLQAIKAAFDPRNQLNPGKIATPGEGRLLTIDGVPTRGQRDRTIPRDARAGFDEALHCNGNGACYNFDPDDAMCPSWKATRERRHSPKGRASLIREWLRQLAAKGVDPVEESRRLRRTPAWRTLPARLRNGIARSRGEARFLPRGQGGHGWLPRLQVLRRPMPDQGRCSKLPCEVPGTLLRALPASATGLLRCLARTSRTACWRGCLGFTTVGGKQSGTGGAPDHRPREVPGAVGSEPRAGRLGARCRGCDAGGTAQPECRRACPQRRSRAGRLHKLFRNAARP